MDSQVRHALTVGAILLTILAVLIVSPLSRAVTRASWPPPGPLGLPATGWSLGSVSTTLGQVYSYDVIDPPEYHGAEPLVFDGAVPNTPVPDGLEVVGYRVIRNTEGIGGGIGVVEGFLPAGYVPHPVRGYVYAGGDQRLQVVVGLKATRPGDYLLPGFTLAYHLGKTHFMAVYTQGAGLCAGEVRPTGCDLGSSMP